MAPEIERSRFQEYQKEAMSEWIEGKAGRLVASVSHMGEYIRVYEVDGEPVVSYHKYTYDGKRHEMMFFSEKIAYELEEAGVVSFQEVAEEAK